MTTEEYILAHTDKESSLLANLNRITHLRMINPRMLSGHFQGRVLAMFCKMIAPKRILEVGTYTGYSALCMAESLPEDGVLHTIECDDELEDFILEQFSKSPYSQNIQLHIGAALKVIPELNESFDVVFLDADKREYLAYYELVLPKLREGGFILVDNTLWDGKVLETAASNDAQTVAIMNFNTFVANDTRVEKVMLPLRDGITIIRKKQITHY
jgi:caffeoyl-CoA O-methyltransferase